MAEQEFTTEELECEEWRDVFGYEGYYSISSLGRVRRDKCGGRGARKTPRILRSGLGTTGYPLVVLSKDCRPRTMAVHLLVATAFIGPRPLGYQINHKDGIRTSNRATNLEYVTPAENIRHAIEVLNAVLPTRPRGAAWHAANKHIPKGSEHSMAKLDETKVREIRSLYANGVSQAQIGKRYGVHYTTVGLIVRRLMWKHVQ